MIARIGVGLLCIGLAARVWADTLPTYILPNHQLSLKTYLKAHPKLSVAPEAVCACEQALAQHRQQNELFQPYYAVGDINDDAVEDFAVGLLHKNSADEKPVLTLVIFHGPFKPDKANKGIVAIKKFPVARPKEVLSVFRARQEGDIRIPARLDLGPGVFGSDDVFVIFYNHSSKRYTVKYFYDE